MLLRIGVYPYESMDGWNWFNKTTLSDKGNNLNMEILDIWNKIMEKMFVKILKQKKWVNIIICILKARHCY